MNSSEFFMTYAGYKLLPVHLRTGDAIADARTLLSVATKKADGGEQRIMSFWMVITPLWVASSLKAPASAGFILSSDMGAFQRRALRSLHAPRAARAPDKCSDPQVLTEASWPDAGQPFMAIKTGKRTLTPEDLYVTHDARAMRLCSAGDTRTIDATKEILGWMF